MGGCGAREVKEAGCGREEARGRATHSLPSQEEGGTGVLCVGCPGVAVRLTTDWLFVYFELYQEEYHSCAYGALVY